MTQIFFYSPTGYGPLKDSILRPMLKASHGWNDGHSEAVYGVCVVTDDPHAVADRLVELGVHVLPGLHSADKPHPAIHTALAHHGIKPNHGTREITDLMHKASGMPVLRPHYF